jgi:amiloride-sensitive sodium channel subunit alpha
LDYRGILILVDDQANFLIKNQGVLNSGVYSKISINKVVTELLPYPYGVCLHDNQINTTLAAEMRNLGYNYSRQNCITFCEQHQTIQNVGCYDLRLPRILNSKPCDTQELFDKLNQLTFDYNACNDFCPYECSSLSYKVSTSYATYPTYNFYVSETTQKPQFYEDLFHVKDVTYEIYADGLGGIFIGFDKLRYRKLTDKPAFEIMDIFANVGGTLGLFLGFSILSVFELFDLIFNVVLVTIKIYKTRAALREELSTAAASTANQRF